MRLGEVGLHLVFRVAAGVNLIVFLVVDRGDVGLEFLRLLAVLLAAALLPKKRVLLLYFGRLLRC